MITVKAIYFTAYNQIVKIERTKHIHLIIDETYGKLTIFNLILE